MLRRRFRNFGSEINISIQGVLTKAEVTDILNKDNIRVAYIDQNGIPQQSIVTIDDKLKKINPEYLESEKQLN